MKRAILTGAALAIFGLFATAGARAQNKPVTAKPTPTPIEPMPTPTEPTPSYSVTGLNPPQIVRRVQGRTLYSAALPPIRIRFGKEFEYAGTQTFILYDSARVEQFFFVEAPRGRRIKRMFMVQFEGFLPSNNRTYDYNLKKTVKLGGLDFMYDAAAVNVPSFRKQYPDSDAARAATFLESKGYHLEGEDIMFQRFVRLVDEARRNELLIIYYENPAGRGLSATDLSEGGRAYAQREKVFQELMARALKDFRVLK